MLARARALGLFGRLRVARLFPLVFVPLATGCTLWYLATDPFDGLGGESDGGASGDATTINESGSADAGVDTGCGALDTTANCGACGVTCGGSAGCLQSTVDFDPGPFHCGAVEVSTTGFVAQAVTVWADRLYVVDAQGGVWVCNGTCDDTDSFVQLAVGGSETGCYIAASSKGLFWSTLSPDAIKHIDFDGGPFMPLTVVSPQVVSAAGSRLAWTSGPGTDCQAFKPPPIAGTLFFQANPVSSQSADAGPNISAAADVRNVAFIDDGGALAWTFNEEALRITTLIDDGGVGTAKDFGDAGVGDLVVGSDGQHLALTSESKTVSGGVFDLPGSGGSLVLQAKTSSGVNGAAVFFGNGLIYWSDTKGSISYCAPNPPDACGTVSTIMHGQNLPLAEIVANSKHIFFTTGGINGAGAVLYRIDPLP